MTQAYISIGSNIEAKKNIAKVKKELNQLFICTFSDNFYSEAEGFEGKDFINLVAGFETSLDAFRLTQTLKLTLLGLLNLIFSTKKLFAPS